MGIQGLEDEPASAAARQVCAEHGVDISAHRSRPVTGEDMQRADLILCMEPGHAKYMKTFYPWHRDRVFLMGAWPGKATRKSGVRDPIGAPVGVYRTTFGILEAHVRRILEHL
jgi:protein-tyrosine phosphatase